MRAQPFTDKPVFRLPRSLVVASALLAVACAGEPRARAVNGPDGSPMLHVACGADQGACFELAGQSCPHGYKLFPLFDPRDNNFLVRCLDAREMAAEPAPANSGKPKWSPPAPALPPQESAPASARVSVTSKPAPRVPATANDPIDIGY